MTKYRSAFRMLGLVAVVAVFAAAVSAQSLGEIARQQRAKKQQEKSEGAKTTRVFTNDNLPKATVLSGSQAEAAEGAAGEKAGDKEQAAAGKAAEGAAPGEASKEDKAALEKEYLEKAAKLKEALAYEEKKLDVLQREFNLASVQYYSDPNQALREQTTRGELNTKEADIEKQKAAVEAAKKALADLEEEIHRKGLPAGLAR